MRYVDEIFDRMHCMQLNTFSYSEFAWFKKNLPTLVNLFGPTLFLYNIANIFNNSANKTLAFLFGGYSYCLS